MRLPYYEFLYPPLQPTQFMLGTQRIYASTIIGGKRCNCCQEFWPADTEFFFVSNKQADGLENVCKACRTEKRLTAVHA